MVYLDNAATTFPKPEEVYLFMDYFYRTCGVNVGRGQYQLAGKASNLVKETRQLLLELMDCPQKQVVFTPSATEALNIILQGINWKHGATVYITPFEHNAVLRVLNYLKGIYELSIIELPLDKENMRYDLEVIKYKFHQIKPDVLIMSHASNVCGLVAPIEDICNLAKQHDAICVIDMAQTAGLIRTNLSKVQADYIVFAGHKTLYAPYGVAGFILDKNATLKPLIYGGTGLESANQEMPTTIPERFEAGSLNIQAIAGLNASLRWIKHTGIDIIHRKEMDNKKLLLNVLEQFDNISIVGYAKGQEYIGVLSCTFDRYACDSIGQVLNDQGIAVRTGLHCAPKAHYFLGTFPQGTVRFSTGYFNEPDDFKNLHKALAFIADNSE